MLTSFTPKILSIAILSILVTACGGDSGGSSSSVATPNATDDSVVNTDTKTVEDEEISIVTEQDGDNITETLTPETPEVPVDKTTAVDVNANSDDQITNPIPPANSNALSSEEAVVARLNERRGQCGFGELSVSQKLTTAANNHASYLMYMSKYSTELFQGHLEVEKDQFSGIKNPYYTGETYEDRIKGSSQTGSSATPVKYEFRALGEDLSFLTYNNDYAKAYSHNDIALSSINGLLAAPYHLASLVSPNFSQVGVSYTTDSIKKPLEMSDGTFVPAQGSILELMLGRPLSQQIPELKQVVSYPCQGITETAYELRNESPNPFKGKDRNLKDNPIGQPIYILGNGNQISVTNYQLKDAAGRPVDLIKLNKDSDPNKRLNANEVILMPATALKPSQRYNVSYTVSVDGGDTQNKSFSFTTRAK